MAELIAIGTAQVNSADFTLAAGETATLYLKDVAGQQVESTSIARVQIKSSEGEYFNIGELNCRELAKVLSGAGTYRVQRLSANVAFGVDKN